MSSEPSGAVAAISATRAEGLSSDPELRPAGSLTATLWHAAATTYEAILQHPFLERLGDGSLEPDQFAYYLIQDGHYIRAFTQCLATLAGRAPTQDSLDMLVAHSGEAVALESTLHAELLGALGLPYQDPAQAPESPTTVAYSSSLLATCARDSFLGGLVAVLPCYWIYARVGHHMATVRSPNPVFARWIENYSGGAYDGAVSEVLDCADRFGAVASPVERARCVELYRRSAQYEWMFWDAAYRRETWPI